MKNQRGSALLLVLVMLTILLLAALSMARITDAGGLVSGNIALKDAATQSSDVGVAEAFAALQTVTDENTNQGGWYYATKQTDATDGIPSVNWSSAASVTVGNFTVKYVIERMCFSTPITDATKQCITQQGASTTVGSSKFGAETLAGAIGKQYRITVFVTGPKDTQTYTQVTAIK